MKPFVDMKPKKRLFRHQAIVGALIRISRIGYEGAARELVEEIVLAAQVPDLSNLLDCLVSIENEENQGVLMVKDVIETCLRRRCDTDVVLDGRGISLAVDKVASVLNKSWPLDRRGAEVGCREVFGYKVEITLDMLTNENLVDDANDEALDSVEPGRARGSEMRVIAKYFNFRK